MAKGISVGIASDTRDFIKGVKSGMVTPLEDAQSALDDLGKHGTEAGTVLERTFSKQQTETEQLRQKIGQLNEDIKSKGRQAWQEVAQDAEQSTRRAEEGVSELKDSSRQNAIETAASFDGSFQSIAGGAQGLVSEALAGFGPAGIAAGLVAAGGIGLISTAVDNATQQVQVDQQAVATLAQQYMDAGTKGKLAFDDVAAALEDMATNASGSAIITLQDAYKAATEAGTDYASVVKSIASSDPTQIESALRRVQALKDAANVTGSLNDQTKVGVDLDSRAALGHVEQQGAVLKLESALKKAKEQATQAGRAQELAAEAGLSKLQQKINLIGQLHTGYSDAAAGVDSYMNKEKTVLDVSKYISAMEKRRTELKKYEDELSGSKLSAQARSFLEAQGADTAAAMMAGYEKASPRQKAQLDAIWTTAGKSNAASYGDALGGDVSKIKTPAPKITRPVVPAPDTSRLDAFLRTPRVAKIVIEGYTRTGQRVL